MKEKIEMTQISVEPGWGGSWLYDSVNLLLILSLLMQVITAGTKNLVFLVLSAVFLAIAIGLIVAALTAYRRFCNKVEDALQSQLNLAAVKIKNGRFTAHRSGMYVSGSFAEDPGKDDLLFVRITTPD